jgi:hypothetical protein
LHAQFSGDNDIIADNGEVPVDKPFKTLRECAAELHISHETARRAALKGKLPAFQPFGFGTAWCVHPDYENFLIKSAIAESSTQENG